MTKNEVKKEIQENLRAKGLVVDYLSNDQVQVRISRSSNCVYTGSFSGLYEDVCSGFIHTFNGSTFDGFSE
ncbi:MAG: hypothetical protein Q9M28_04775 [Mariprofundaceae bacterium]|nr:hypothetical protein [Mariprofundaceae bacterium]